VHILAAHVIVPIPRVCACGRVLATCSRKWRRRPLITHFARAVTRTTQTAWRYKSCNTNLRNLVRRAKSPRLTHGQRKSLEIVHVSRVSWRPLTQAARIKFRVPKHGECEEMAALSTTEASISTVIHFAALMPLSKTRGAPWKSRRIHYATVTFNGRQWWRNSEGGAAGYRRDAADAAYPQEVSSLDATETQVICNCVDVSILHRHALPLRLK
jgi:hypothetical protein